MQLTPVAALQEKVAASNILDVDGSKVNYRGIPSAVFTIPVPASVGISAAKDSNEYMVILRARSSGKTTRRAGVEFTASKIILDEASGRIMGAHILEPSAEEAINIFAMAIRLNLSVSDIKEIIFTCPTVCSDIPYML